MLTKRKIIVEVKTHKCVVCRNYFKPNVFTSQAKRNLCSTDNFWYDLMQMRDDKNVARIEGQHYIIGDPGVSLKGMSGRTFKIIFFDGREVTTDNLWHQGKIPQFWRDEWLQDNAIFYKEVKL